ncbi:MAG: endonuclease/exonuclease/phosphatase family protein [Bacteroidales bacterium]|nr:endonuclease/exonuclease/phosphatase family protein [Candidatus Colimorpha onthohippi]
MRKILHSILLTINILFAVALLASSVAELVKPSTIILFSLLSYGYLILVIANLCFVLLWLLLRRMEAIVSVVAILVRCSLLSLFFQVGGTSEASYDDDSCQLSVMTFNLHSLMGPDAQSTASENAPALVSLFRQYQPDVVCLQEYYEPQFYSLSDTLKHIGYQYWFRSKRLVMLSRLQLDDTTRIDKYGKLMATVTINDKKITLIGVHLDSYQLDQDDLNNVEHPNSNKMLPTIKKFSETIRQHETEWHQCLLPVIESIKTPLILMGDHNDTPSSYLYGQITQYLSDTYCECGQGFGTTYHGPFPAFRIDYIFHSPHLQTLSYQRIITNISDHYPILSKYTIN